MVGSAAVMRDRSRELTFEGLNLMSIVKYCLFPGVIAEFTLVGTAPERLKTHSSNKLAVVISGWYLSHKIKLLGTTFHCLRPTRLCQLPLGHLSSARVCLVRPVLSCPILFKMTAHLTASGNYSLREIKGPEKCS